MASISASIRKSVMHEELTERLDFSSPGANGSLRLVTYPGQGSVPAIYRPFVTNPAAVAELCLFMSILALGLLLMYVGSKDTHPTMYDYGIVFFNAGVVPSIISFVAPLVRNVRSRDDLINKALERKEAFMYLFFVVLGIALVLIDREDFQAEQDGGTFKTLVGGTLLEAGLVYVAIRSFLRNEAPEDRVRGLEEEVAYLRESVSKGISQAYFLNFCKWLVKDMVKSRVVNNGMVDFQPSLPRGTPANQTPPAPVQEDIAASIVVIPMLGETDFWTP